MRRTELLQEIWKMQFEEIYGNWRGKRLSQEEAARLLGVSTRTFRRYAGRFEEMGAEGSWSAGARLVPQRPQRMLDAVAGERADVPDFIGKMTGIAM